MGYRLNRLDEPVFMAGPKPMQTEFGIHQRLESCVSQGFYFKDGKRSDITVGLKSSCTTFRSIKLIESSANLIEGIAVLLRSLLSTQIHRSVL